MSRPPTSQTGNAGSIEELFQGLPPLGSDLYIERVRTAPRRELPAEVLVRAFRQLPPNSPAARATLKRLFGRAGKQWEYLQPIARMAHRQAKTQQDQSPGDEGSDLFQDFVVHVLQKISTDRGAFAETAWNAFCWRAFWDAWRRRYGRRGEKFGPARGDPQGTRRESGEDVATGPEQLSDSDSPWQALSHDDQSPQIEAIALKVVDGFENPFHRDVARAVLLSSERPQVSGASKPDRAPPLTEQFPERSRDQLNRALRAVDSSFAAALLADDNLSWSDHLRKLLEKQKNRGKRK